MSPRARQESTPSPSIREGGLRDLDGIASLFRSDLGREPDTNRIGQHLTGFPSAVAEADGFGLVAFAFTTSFAPDILELANILVSSKWRDHDIGSRLLEKIEKLAQEDFSAIILVNSMLYPTAGKKRPATDFYLRAGYEGVMQTSNSVVFGKSLPQNTKMTKV